MKPLVRNAARSSYVELSQSLGIDPRALMKRVGLDPVGLAIQDRWIPGVAVTDLLELSAVAARREDFGLLLAERRRFSNLGPISLVLREEPDVPQRPPAPGRHERMYNEMLRSRGDRANGLATVKVSLDGEARGSGRPSSWPLVCSTDFCGSSSAPAGGRCPCVHPRSPSRRRRTPAPLRAGGGIRPGIQRPRFLRHRTRHPQYDVGPPAARLRPPVFRVHRGGSDTTELDRVRELIEVLLPTGRCSIEQVAGSLGVDRRTVHRHLAASGETFSSLVNATRTQLAEQLVANPRRSLTEISGLLGFSTPSAFSRWFRDRFGTSAREWRTRRAATGPVRTTTPSPPPLQ